MPDKIFCFMLHFLDRNPALPAFPFLPLRSKPVEITFHFLSFRNVQYGFIIAGQFPIILIQKMPLRLGAGVECLSSAMGRLREYHGMNGRI